MARFGRAQQATALLPLAVLSAAWTAGLATAGSHPPSGSTLPDGARVPSRAIKAPASLSGGLPRNPQRVVSAASANGIPAVALAAYQQAASVIDAADRSCHLPWQLIAAIGRVESDHGRADGNTLTDRGFDKPGIYGPELNGKHGTVLIKDTDAGQYDRDAKFDRAVGPMQFIPSTWAIVGVDGDSDGKRDPQDIYDASLASAVYLCSGTDNLATLAGQRPAVFRYNHNQRYVDLVLAIERAYLRGDFASVANDLTSTGFSLADPQAGPRHHRVGRHHRHHHHHHHHSPGGDPSTGPTTGPTSGPTAGPTGGPTSGPTHSPGGPVVSVPPVTIPGGPTVSVPPVTVPTAIPTILTQAQAVVACLAKGLVDNPLDPNDAFDKCVYKLTH